MSLDERHQYERAAILGSRSDSVRMVPTLQNLLPHSNKEDVSSHDKDNLLPNAKTTISKNFEESLDDFELTCHHGYDSDQVKDEIKSNDLLIKSKDNKSKPLPKRAVLHSDRIVTAPLSAGVRGFMHGLVGGMTSIVVQPYRGIQEDQFKVIFVIYAIIFF